MHQSCVSEVASTVGYRSFGPVLDFASVVGTGGFNYVYVCASACVSVFVCGCVCGCLRAPALLCV